MRYEIIFEANIKTVSAAFVQLEQSARGCVLPGEVVHSESLFKEYNHERCKFECDLKRSAKACQCTPWDYPQMGELTKVGTS